MQQIREVAIIGGGVSGSVVAMELAFKGIDFYLFEAKSSLVNGPPFCHLHAGGNLYPDITIEECKTLLKQSIEMARLFPESIDRRPTVIAVQKNEPYDIDVLASKLVTIQNHYEELCKEDAKNDFLGKPEDYFKTYTLQELEEIKQTDDISNLSGNDVWMYRALQGLDLNKIKPTVFLVQEYGWNLFRLAAQAEIILKKINQEKENSLQLNCEVIDIVDCRDFGDKFNWIIKTKNGAFKTKYLINTCGYKTGTLDKVLNLNPERMLEFKAAYVSSHTLFSSLIPEMIFLGRRGTANGMVQLTPYADGHFQIHGMNKEVTLFDDGLIDSKDDVQPEFREELSEKLEKGWTVEDTEKRTRNAINHVADFYRNFVDAETAGPPMFGAQQIPGDNADLRVGEVDFPHDFYARSEIVKASSALTVSNKIIDKWDLKNQNETNEAFFTWANQIDATELNEYAQKLAEDRGYSKSMGKLLIPYS